MQMPQVQMPQVQTLQAQLLSGCRGSTAIYTADAAGAGVLRVQRLHCDFQCRCYRCRCFQGVAAEVYDPPTLRSSPSTAEGQRQRWVLCPCHKCLKVVQLGNIRGAH